MVLGFLLAAGGIARAQYGGELILGGRFNYVGGGRVVTPEGKKVNTGYTLKISPSLAYFIRNGLAIGVNTGYEYVTDDNGHQHTGEIIPFLRYDFGGGRVRVFAQAESGVGWGKSRMDDGNRGKHFLWNSALKPGIFVRITEHLGSEMTVSSLKYNYVKATDLDNGESTVRHNWKFRWLDLSWGLYYIF